MKRRGRREVLTDLGRCGRLLLDFDIGAVEGDYLLDSGFGGCVDVIERCVGYIVEHYSRAVLGAFVGECEVVGMETVHVACVKSVGRCLPGEFGFGIVGALFTVLLVDEFLGSTALELKPDVVQPHVADGFVGESGDDY